LIIGRQIAGLRGREGLSFVLHEPEIVAYHIRFDAEKGCLRLDNGVYFDKNYGDAIS